MGSIEGSARPGRYRLPIGRGTQAGREEQATIFEVDHAFDDERVEVPIVIGKDHRETAAQPTAFDSVANQPRFFRGEPYLGFVAKEQLGLTNERARQERAFLHRAVGAERRFAQVAFDA